MGGYGGHIPAWGLGFAQPLPVCEMQTNNRVELPAAIFLLENTPSDISKLLVATDSKYVSDGMQGPVYRWKVAHWCTHKGPMANADLWAALLAAQEACQAGVSWCWILSHVSIPGNEEADALAECGRLMSSLYQSKVEQDVPPAEYVYTPVKPPPLECYTPCSTASGVRARGVSPLRGSPYHTLRVEPVGQVLFTPSSYCSDTTTRTASTVSYALTLTPSESHFVSTPVKFLADLGMAPMLYACQQSVESQNSPVRTPPPSLANLMTCLSCAFLPHRHLMSSLTLPPRGDLDE